MSILTDYSADLGELLSDAELPAMPQSAIKMMELSRSRQPTLEELARPIDADPGLSAQVLRFANSSYFGFESDISNVKLAIVLVGVRTIQNYVLWSAVFSLMPNPKCGPFQLTSLWYDSLRRALFARHLVKGLEVEGAEEAFTAALLQDMAVPLLAKELPNDYAQLLAERDGGRYRLSDLERQRFGWTHAEAAGIMARQWQLPPDLVDLIECHTEMPVALDTHRDVLSGIVNLSALLPSSTDRVWRERDEFAQGYAELKCSTHLVLEKLLASVDEELEGFASAFKLSTLPRSLAESLLASV